MEYMTTSGAAERRQAVSRHDTGRPAGRGPPTKKEDGSTARLIHVTSGSTEPSSPNGAIDAPNSRTPAA